MKKTKQTTPPATNTAAKPVPNKYVLGIVFGAVCSVGALVLLCGYVYTFTDMLSDAYNLLLNTVRVVFWVCFAAFTLASGIKGKSLPSAKAVLWAVVGSAFLRCALSLLFMLTSHSDFHALSLSYTVFDLLHQLTACMLYALCGLCAYFILKDNIHTAKWASAAVLVLMVVNMLAYCFAYIDALSYYYSYLADVLSYALPAALGNSFVEIFGSVSLFIYCIKYDK